MNRHMIGWIVVLSAVIAAAPTARAEGFRLDRYRTPALATDGLTLPRPATLAASQWSVGVRLDYSNDPLVLELERGVRDTEYANIVDDQLQGQLAFAFGALDSLSVFGVFNATILMEGERTPMPGMAQRQLLADGAGIGDARVGARYRFIGGKHERAGLGAEAALIVPLAEFADSDQNFRGEHGFAGDVSLLADVDLTVLRIGGAVGVRLRQETAFIETEVGHELTLGLGASVPFAKGQVEAIVEGYASTALTNAFASDTSPTEVIAGVRATAMSNWRFMAGAGPGLSRGVGAPDFRVIGGVSYVSDGPSEAHSEPVEDFFVRDSDGDGVLDTNDKCPEDAEDQDSHQDDDGCPDRDNDGDGVFDAADNCPGEVEDKDNYRDEDGCIDGDNDGDGVLDAADGCPNEAEDKDGVADDDGCADGDNDGDGIDDARDKCPTVPGDLAHQGCSAEVSIEGGQIRIHERVEFGNARADLLPASSAVLAAVKGVLEVNPKLTQIMVMGHTDGRGANTKNLDLSKRRAASVVGWLVQEGISPDRLSAWGCGEARPVADDKTESGRQQNRRVEFHVVDPQAPPPSTEGCEASAN
jgi:outer membrane protein OmpA-like peptidoglycan-associated protein